jgi:hypothetical protein
MGLMKDRIMVSHEVHASLWGRLKVLAINTGEKLGPYVERMLDEVASREEKKMAKKAGAR